MSSQQQPIYESTIQPLSGDLRYSPASVLRTLPQVSGTMSTQIGQGKGVLDRVLEVPPLNLQNDIPPTTLYQESIPKLSPTLQHLFAQAPIARFPPHLIVLLLRAESEKTSLLQSLLLATQQQQQQQQVASYQDAVVARITALEEYQRQVIRMIDPTASEIHPVQQTSHYQSVPVDISLLGNEHTNGGGGVGIDGTHAYATSLSGYLSSSRLSTEQSINGKRYRMTTSEQLQHEISRQSTTDQSSQSLSTFANSSTLGDDDDDDDEDYEEPLEEDDGSSLRDYSDSGSSFDSFYQQHQQQQQQQGNNSHDSEVTITVPAHTQGDVNMKTRSHKPFTPSSRRLTSNTVKIKRGGKKLGRAKEVDITSIPRRKLGMPPMEQINQYGGVLSGGIRPLNAEEFLYLHRLTIDEFNQKYINDRRANYLRRITSTNPHGLTDEFTAKVLALPTMDAQIEHVRTALIKRWTNGRHNLGLSHKKWAISRTIDSDTPLPAEFDAKARPDPEEQQASPINYTTHALYGLYSGGIRPLNHEEFFFTHGITKTTFVRKYTNNPTRNYLARATSDNPHGFTDSFLSSLPLEEDKIPAKVEAIRKALKARWENWKCTQQRKLWVGKRLYDNNTPLPTGLRIPSESEEPSLDTQAVTTSMPAIGGGLRPSGQGQDYSDTDSHGSSRARRYRYDLDANSPLNDVTLLTQAIDATNGVQRYPLPSPGSQHGQPSNSLSFTHTTHNAGNYPLLQDHTFRPLRQSKSQQNLLKHDLQLHDKGGLASNDVHMIATQVQHHQHQHVHQQQHQQHQHQIGSTLFTASTSTSASSSFQQSSIFQPQQQQGSSLGLYPAQTNLYGSGSSSTTTTPFQTLSTTHHQQHTHRDTLPHSTSSSSLSRDILLNDPKSRSPYRLPTQVPVIRGTSAALPSPSSSVHGRFMSPSGALFTSNTPAATLAQPQPAYISSVPTPPMTMDQMGAGGGVGGATPAMPMITPYLQTSNAPGGGTGTVAGTSPGLTTFHRHLSHSKTSNHATGIGSSNSSSASSLRGLSTLPVTTWAYNSIPTSNTITAVAPAPGALTIQQQQQQQQQQQLSQQHQRQHSPIQSIPLSQTSSSSPVPSLNGGGSGVGLGISTGLNPPHPSFFKPLGTTGVPTHLASGVGGGSGTPTGQTESFSKPSY